MERECYESLLLDSRGGCVVYRSAELSRARADPGGGASHQIALTRRFATTI
jgi:hypothetical protein